MVDDLRRYPPPIAWLASIKDEEVVLPGFVLMELIQGCRNRRDQRALEMSNELFITGTYPAKR
jgi:predicted nucleic acid-binding protein